MTAPGSADMLTAKAYLPFVLKTIQRVKELGGASAYGAGRNSNEALAQLLTELGYVCEDTEFGLKVSW